jgi:photosystem II stability/assembly factor-like uncharacterized protein
MALANSRSWTEKNYDSLYGYYLVNPENGKCVQAALHGASWMKDNNPASALSWVNATTGWLTRSGQVFKSIDGGARWEWQQTGCPVSASAFDFLDNGRKGWAAGGVGLFSRTGDGSTWSCLDISNFNVHAMNAVFFVDTNFGWVAGELGTILHTKTGGTTWYPQISNTSEALHAIRFSDRRNGWAVGDHGTIIRTTDVGENWTLQASQTTQTLFSVSFVDSTEGWAVGNFGTIVHTTDGGAHWHRHSSGTHRHLLAVDFVNPNRGYAVGEGSSLLKFNR